MTARTMLSPALTFGARSPMLDPERALTARVQMVLETRPGRMPWRPDFGCDLASLAGQPASAATMGLARMRITESLRRWIPELKIVRCRVRLATDVGLSRGRTGSEVPLAEAALMRLGAQGWLEISLDLEADFGSVSMTASVQP